MYLKSTTVALFLIIKVTECPAAEKSYLIKIDICKNIWHLKLYTTSYY